MTKQNQSKEVSFPIIRAIRIPTKSMPFLCSLYKWLGVGRRWEVVEDWTYQLDEETEIFIPKGFVFDGASIPRIFRPLLSPMGIFLIPSVIHDYSYQKNMLTKISDGKKTPYKYHAGKWHWDSVFYKISRDVNGLKIVSFFAWFALVIGGGAAWYSHNGNEIIKKIANIWLEYSNVSHLFLFVSFMVWLYL
jgi:hypothetical protein